MVADSVNPELTSAVATKNNKIALTFSEDVNATALNIANYSIEGLQVLSAEYKKDADGNSIKNEVILTTAAQTEGTIYKLIATNVQDLNGNVVDSAKDEALFGGIAKDTVKPRVGHAVAVSNIHVEVKFNEEVSELSAENVANYSIPGLTVVSAELDADDKTKVTLKTSAQTEGTIYKLTVTNVTDEDGNTVDTDYDEAQFGGIAADTSKPELLGAVATTNTKVSLTFNEKLDKAVAENVANYSIPGLTVTAAKLNTAGTGVTLTTTAQTEGTIYKLSVANVTDVFGNVIDSSKDEFQFGGLSADTTKPTLVSATSGNAGKSVSIVFSEKLDAKTANMPQNYNLGTELGYALKAELQADGVTVVLTTKQQNAKVYTVDVTGVTDQSGNAISEDADEIKFAGQGSTDTTAPRVTSAVAVNKNTVRVTFNEQVSTTGLAASDFTLTTAAGGAVAGMTNPTAVKRTADKMSVLLQWDDAESFTSGTIYKIVVAGVNDLAGVSVDANYDEVQFAGSSAANAAPEASAAVAINNKTIKVNFSEAVKLEDYAGANDFVVANDLVIEDADGNAVDVSDATFELSEDGRTLTVYLQTGAVTSGEIYSLELQAGIYDELGVATLNYNKTVSFAGVGSTTTAPKVNAVVATNQDTLEVTFDKKVQTLDVADFAVDLTADRAPVSVELDATGTKATFFFDSSDAATQKFVAGTVYTLVVADDALVNMNGVASDAITAQFAGTSKTNAAPSLLDARYVTADGTIEITFSEALNLDIDGDGTASDADDLAALALGWSIADSDTDLADVDPTVDSVAIKTGTDNVLVLTLDMTGADLDSGLTTITYDASAGSVEDLNLKAIAEDTTIQFVK
ncbi:Ig-like domain-containing protein [Bacillus sp. ISL-41]|uniref:Ig-like domain-containing protein n=1 Tax=Bacillus sp. ISL-41 TaxID=2819127 RepID=UPI001BE7B8E9|nr:Ig-like domain-containing protein [Bacillus sp. ISL-41]MBT2641718.1 Ig-like domain-containing protein [Bacillus sp. ISL-41]